MALRAHDEREVVQLAARAPIRVICVKPHISRLAVAVYGRLPALATVRILALDCVPLNALRCFIFSIMNDPLLKTFSTFWQVQAETLEGVGLR